MSPRRPRTPTPPDSTRTPVPHAGPLTGIKRLDRELEGLPSRPHVVLLHDSGMEAGAFLLHTAFGAGGHVVYATTSRAPESIEAELRRLAIVGAAEPTWVDLREVRDAPEIARRIEEAARPDSTLALEGLTGVVHGLGEAAARDWFTDLRTAWQGRRLLALLSDRAYEAATRERLLSTDAVVRLTRRELRGARHEAFQVVRATGRSPKVLAYPYRIERPGGVRPHLSKVLVTGAYSAGKSTLVHTLSETGVNVEHLGTTVALDHGRIDRDGLTIDLFGTPGQERFDPIIRQVGHGALGVISVVDCARPSTLHRARQLADEISGGQVPVVYAANKQDAPGALSPADVRERLGVGDAVPVIACSAVDRASAVAVLDALVERVLAALAVSPAAPPS